MSRTEQLQALQAELERLAQLAGFAAFLNDKADQLHVTSIALRELATEGDYVMALADILREQAAAVRASSEAVKTAIDSAIARLSDNPDAASIEAAIADLTAANESNAASLAAATSIDPDDTSGGVVGDGEGGVTEATEAPVE